MISLRGLFWLLAIPALILFWAAAIAWALTLLGVRL
jgi:hypothetical protein